MRVEKNGREVDELCHTCGVSRLLAPKFKRRLHDGDINRDFLLRYIQGAPNLNVKSSETRERSINEKKVFKVFRLYFILNKIAKNKQNSFYQKI